MNKDQLLEEILDALYLAKDATRIYPTFPVNIKSSHLHVLYAINNLGKEVRISDVSKEMLITLPNITNLIKELEKLGLVKKTSLKSDKRVILVQLTNEGFKVLDKYFLDYKRRIADMLQVEDSEKYQVMVESIKKVNELFKVVTEQINEKNEEI
ncbi:MarR family winged helix-turn-helix transcriptional regulator [Priestia megaterium]|uniref:MarR family winged helix-turn-helix transcriptional regulator n=1 Tax=Priestia megaterium TaxID=1404 RepID=UPI002798BA5F|nr:MarR family transcriptional regulator [Priestia megaterium]WDC91158.1 MarR family transcriptional regulator [Priestia megaterium]